MVIKSYSPVTEELIGEFAKTPISDIAAILTSAKSAQKKWCALSKSERIAVLEKVKASFDKNQQELIQTVHEECGFALTDTQDVVYDVLDGFDHYSAQYLKKENIEFPIDKNVFPESTSQIKLYPHGVVVQIGIWNYPLWQTMISAIPALLTGNAIIFKPSEKATKTGLLISRIINETEGFPKDLFILVVGDSVQGKHVVSSSVDAIVYTGNIKTGKDIISAAGTKPVIAELSGNDAAIVCADCDIEQTVAGVVGGAFYHAGEVCDRIKRVYVLKDIAEEFIAQITARTESITEKISPLISLTALETVASQIQKTVLDGAKVLCGAKRLDKKGFYYAPTILQLDHNEVASVSEEIFGPVLSVLVVDSEEQALIYANSTAYGLGTSIWTQDFVKAEVLADKSETGMVWINDSNIPLVCGEYFQGWKSTSIPSAGDRLSKFMKSKTVISFNSKNKRDWWF